MKEFVIASSTPIWHDLRKGLSINQPYWQNLCVKIWKQEKKQKDEWHLCVPERYEMQEFQITLSNPESLPNLVLKADNLGCKCWIQKTVVNVTLTEKRLKFGNFKTFNVTMFEEERSRGYFKLERRDITRPILDVVGYIDAGRDSFYNDKPDASTLIKRFINYYTSTPIVIWERLRNEFCRGNPRWKNICLKTWRRVKEDNEEDQVCTPEKLEMLDFHVTFPNTESLSNQHLHADILKCECWIEDLGDDTKQNKPANEIFYLARYKTTFNDGYYKLIEKSTNDDNRILEIIDYI